MIIQASNIGKSFQNHVALKNLNVEVPRGSIFGLLGPNGAGKTTFLRIINQIIAPDSGKLLLYGKELTDSDVHRIGYLPEERGLYKKMKVGEQALYLAQLKGLTKSEATTRLKWWFDHFEMTAWWNKKVEELSKGMQQKVQFVSTVLHQPELLILDEPFSGFDPINTELIKNEILRLKKDGMTVIFSTHRMESVEQICDDITLIHKSTDILSGSVKDIQREFRSNTYTITFKGSLKKLPKGAEMVSENKEENEKSILITPNNNESINKTLGEMIKDVEIVGIKQKAMSMHDIFIEKVNKLS